MNLRYELHEQAARHRLSLDDTAHLLRLANLAGQPARVAERMACGVGLTGAAMIGLAALFFVAANWVDFGRFGRMALLQALFAMAVIAAWRWQALRVPMSLLALLAMGGLLACVGQTYQTGADPWQLFATWALLGLPLCWAVRHDALWWPWMMVAQLAAVQWADAMVGGWKTLENYPLLLEAWAISAATLLLTYPSLRRFTGAGVWSLRFGMTLLVVQITSKSLSWLPDYESPLYWWALLIFAGACKFFRTHIYEDNYCAAISLIGFNILILVGVSGSLFANQSLFFYHSKILPSLLLLGLIIIGLTYVSATLLARQNARVGMDSEETP